MNIRISDIELKAKEQLKIHYKDVAIYITISDDGFAVVYLISASGHHLPVALHDGQWTL